MNPFKRRATPGRIWVFCDGGLGSAAYATPSTEGVRTHCGCGALVRRDGGEVTDWAWRSLPAMTNNEAEYAGLILGAELARKAGVGTTVFVLDSAVVVGQMQGRFAVNSASLRRWHRQATHAVRALYGVQFCLVPREYNALADALAHEAGMPWPDLRRAMERLTREAVT